MDERIRKRIDEVNKLVEEEEGNYKSSKVLSDYQKLMLQIKSLEIKINIILFILVVFIVIPIFLVYFFGGL
ncbi:hypothetical protein RJG79_09105 [Mycoplasmatota bacterium WC44]